MRLVLRNLRWRAVEWLDSFEPIDGERVVERLGVLAARRMP